MANLLKKVGLSDVYGLLFFLQVNQVSMKQEELAAQVKLCLKILLVLVGLAVIIIVVLLFYTSSNAICDKVIGDPSMESIHTSQSEL